MSTTQMESSVNKAKVKTVNKRTKQQRSEQTDFMKNYLSIISPRRATATELCEVANLQGYNWKIGSAGSYASQLEKDTKGEIKQFPDGLWGIKQ